MNNKGTKNKYTGMEIAVIGMSGKFPGAKNLEQYWSNIVNGVESISHFTEEELIAAGCDLEQIREPNYIKAKGVIEDAQYFDSAFFGYTLKDAEIMDPQLRIFHECVWEALEDAGYDPISYNKAIGICIGASSNFNWECSIIKSDNFDPASFPLINKDFLSTLIAYKLNLRGPSMVINTACSTSLVSIHQACRALLTGECNMMIAGATSILAPLKQGYMYDEGFVMSLDGHCRPFDEEAKGTVGGSGTGAVVLKRLADAIEDGDNIYAIIKGSSVNNDGNRKVGYSAPSVDGQALAIRTALRTSRVQPESISYIEAHGTGTNLGDPTEVEALIKAFNSTKKGFCAIGSVKSNIGHLDAASGMASFIKSILILKNRTIPPTIHFNCPNPNINFVESPFYVTNECCAIESEQYPIRVAVNSLGIGGTNAHIILEEYPTAYPEEYLEAVVEDSIEKNTESNVILLSARTESALEKQTKNFVKYLKNNLDKGFNDIAYTLQIGRRGFKHRRMVQCKTAKDALKALTSMDLESIKTSYLRDENKLVAFIFSSDSFNMELGKEIYKCNKYFKELIDECYEASDMGNENIYSSVAELEDTKDFISDKLILISQYCLGKLLISLDIKPSYIIGYGIGEYVAACLSGVFTIKDALSLLELRSKILYHNKPIDKEQVLLKLTNSIKFNTPEISFLSGDLNRWISLEESASAEYWAKSIVAVQISDLNVNPIMDLKNTIFIELALDAKLDSICKFCKAQINDNEFVTLADFSRDVHTYNNFILDKLGQIWLMGKDVKWSTFYKDNKRYKVSLPTYPFERQAHNTRVILHKGNGSGNKLIDESLNSKNSKELDYERQFISTEYEAPVNELEKLIVEILRELLGIEKVGITDDFFELGMDSIKSIRLASRLQKNDYKVRMDKILKSGNVKQLAVEISKMKSEDISTDIDIWQQPEGPYDFKGVDNAMVNKIMEEDTGIESVYPLSPMQKLVLAQNIVSYKKGNDVFILIFKLEGNINVSLFKKAWDELIKRHSILRTKFIWKKVPEPLQAVYKTLDIEFKDADWSNLSIEEQKLEREKYIGEEKAKGFRSTQVPLIRCFITKCNNNLYKFIWSFQHSLFDGWSMHTIIKEMMELYKSYGDNTTPELGESKPFINYIKWIDKQKEANAKEFWSKQFNGFNPKETIAEALYSNVSDKFSIITQDLKLNKTQTKRLNDYVRRNGFTLNTLIQTAWGILMACLTNSDDMIIGVETSGRSESIGDIEAMVGLFINVLPLRINILENEPCISWMRRLQENQLEMRNYEYATIQDIAKWSSIPVKLIQAASYERTLVYQNFPMELRQKDYNGIKISVEERVSQIDVPLRFYATPDEELLMMIVYNEEQYNRDFVKRILDNLEMILNEITSTETVTIFDIRSRVYENKLK